jgi:hypothetical protein
MICPRQNVAIFLFLIDRSACAHTTTFICQFYTQLKTNVPYAWLVACKTASFLNSSEWQLRQQKLPTKHQ